MQLKDICNFKNGKGIKGLNDGTVPLIGSTGVLGYVDQQLISDESCIIARVGANCGFVQYTNYPCWVSDNAIICTSKYVATKYLYYYLSQININSFRTGGAQPLLTSEIIGSINVNIHNQQMQRHIVDTIGSVDDLIEKNQDIIERLEIFGQNLYLHSIEKDYFTIKMSDLSIKYGASIVESNRVDGPYPLFGANGITDYIDRYNSSNTIIIGCRGNSVGSIHYFKEKNYVLNTALYIESKNDYGNLYYALKYNKGLKLYASGSAQPQITIESIENVKLKLVKNINLNFILDNIYKYRKQNQTLTMIKKTLLSKYFN